MFTHDLVKAVSDWQRGGDHQTKLLRGARLKSATAHLPKRFKECDSVCFRQEAHEEDRVFDQLIANQLDESIAAWTTSVLVARNFKGGVPPVGYFGVILTLIPPKGSVVVNLQQLYDDEDFQEALKVHGPNISYFSEGAGRYLGTQSEVVIEIGSLTSASVYSYGGFTGDIATLKSAFVAEFSRDPDEREVAEMATKCGQPWWLGEEGTRGVIARTVPKFIDRVNQHFGGCHLC